MLQYFCGNGKFEDFKNHPKLKDFTIHLKDGLALASFWKKEI